jgi:hypothetical protein
MTGMKEGTGSDPFAEDVVDEPEPESEDQDTDEPEDVLEESPTSEPRRPSKDEIPYIYRRDRVTDERTLYSFYLRSEVYEPVEEDCRHAVQQQLGEPVPKADLREAMLLFAARHPDGVADELRKLGYDIE